MVIARRKWIRCRADCGSPPIRALKYTLHWSRRDGLAGSGLDALPGHSLFLLAQSGIAQPPQMITYDHPVGLVDVFLVQKVL